MTTDIYKYILFLAIIFYGCSKSTSDSSIEVVNINPHEAKDYMNLSEIADSIKYIKLQVAAGDVMGSIWAIVIKKKYIYAMDYQQWRIYVFDKDGKYVAKLDKKGEGPDEYTMFDLMFIDDDEEYIDIITFKGGGGKKILMRYSNISFHLIKTLPFPKIAGTSCKKNDGFYYFATHQFDNVINGNPTNAELIVCKNDTLWTLFDKKIETDNHYFSVNMESFAVNSKNEIFVSLMYDDTFYRLKSGEAYPVCAVNFGKYGINKSIGQESTQKQMEYITNIDGLAYIPVLNMYTEDIMAFSYYFKENESPRFNSSDDDLRQYIRYGDKTYHVKKIKNDITNFPQYINISSYFGSTCIHEVWYEDYFVDIIVPGRYFKNGQEKVTIDGIGEITADDDPVIVLMKMKK
jgi:hypothetical protein